MTAKIIYVQHTLNEKCILLLLWISTLHAQHCNESMLFTAVYDVMDAIHTR